MPSTAGYKIQAISSDKSICSFCIISMGEMTGNTLLNGVATSK